MGLLRRAGTDRPTRALLGVVRFRAPGWGFYIGVVLMSVLSRHALGTMKRGEGADISFGSEAQMHAEKNKLFGKECRYNIYETRGHRH